MAHPALALALLFYALAARLLVPAGFMPAHVGSATVLLPCSGSGAMTMTASGDHHGPAESPGKTQQPCGFAALAHAAMGAADVAPPVEISEFVVANAVRPSIRLANRRLARPCPPSRAPPIGLIA